MEPPEILGDPERVKQAVEEARQFAREQKVPLTMERLAACLGVDPEDIRRAVERFKGCGGRAARKQKAAGKLLEEVSAECRAILMEQGLARSSSPVMPIFGLRANFGYTDKPAPEDASAPAVRFEGEDAIPE